MCIGQDLHSQDDLSQDAGRNRPVCRQAGSYRDTRYMILATSKLSGFKGSGGRGLEGTNKDQEYIFIRFFYLLSVICFTHLNPWPLGSLPAGRQAGRDPFVV
jgi:hypothetical protein